jgi:uroporphyrinogen-III decarboxylase
MMTSRERIAAAMKRQVPDRVPYWCQLSDEHLFRNTLPKGQLEPATIEQRIECECALSRSYGFDGILCGFPGRLPKGYRFNNPQSQASPEKPREFGSIDPEKWTYHYQHATRDEMYGARLAREIAGDDMHIGGSILDPFNYAVNWFSDLGSAMRALIDDPSRFLALVDYYCQESINWALDQILIGDIESIHISCPYAGSSLISRKMYEKFVFPFMKRVAAAIKTTSAFSYIHNCGFLGDRLEMLADSGVDGIECMDPPPLGDVELKDAKRRIGSRVFLKGNLDSVNILLRGSDKDVENSVRSCLDAGMPGGGYILSTACSTAPDVLPERMIHIRDLVEKYGQY